MGKLALTVLFCILSSPVFGATWYVRPYLGGGHGTGAGTSYENAWNSFSGITWGVGGIVAGDTLYVCDNHHSATTNDRTLVIGGDGTSENRITIDGSCPDHTGTIATGVFYYPGGGAGWGDADEFGAYTRAAVATDAVVAFEDSETASPVRLIRETTVPDETWLAGSFYHTGSVVYWKPTGGSTDHSFLLGISGESISAGAHSYVDIKNLTLIGASRGIYLDTGATNIRITSNTIKYSSFAGIWLRFSNSYNTIDSNSISYCGNGIYLSSDATANINSNNTISNNTISYIEYDEYYAVSAEDAQGIAVQGGNNNVVYGNTIYNVAGWGMQWYAYGSQEMKDNQIYGNFIHDIIVGTPIAHAARGFDLGSSNDYLKDDVTGNLFYSNIITDCAAEGIRTKDKKPTTGTSWEFSNNTVENCDVSIKFYMNSALDSSGSVFKNNISINPISYHVYDNIISGSSPSAGSINYNIFYPDTGTKFYWDSTAYNFADWKTNSEQDSNSLSTDPLLVGAGTYTLATHFKLQGASPAKSAGLNLGTGYTDFAGVNLPTPYGWCAGALCYNSFGGGTGSFSGSIQ